MADDVPTFAETRREAMRKKRFIIATVLMANDDVRKVQFGPRGGWKFCK